VNANGLRLGFQIPAHAEVKILVNNVMDANSCSSPRTADDFSSEIAGDQPVHHLMATAAGDGTYVLAPETADEEYLSDVL